MKSVDNEYLKLMEISPEEKTKRGILARLYGPVASTVSTTRNGRKYSQELWEKVFSENEIVKELFAKGGIPGECQHPADRQEIDTEKIAIMMPECPRKDTKTGLLMGYFDILDTPCGKIAYQLAKYGFKLGVSSRGSGDTYTESDGTETVDPTSYDFTCFDLVIIPAVTEARMTMVESLEQKSVKLKKALNEALASASETDRKIMQETLSALNINLGLNPEKDSDINRESSNTINEAADDGADIAKEFLNALKENKDLTKQVRDLQEQLSVCYTKETQLEETISGYEAKISTLSESLDKANAQSSEIEELRNQIEMKNAIIEKLNKSNSAGQLARKSLNESVSAKDTQIASLTAKVSNLTEALESTKTESSSKIKTLTESVEELTKDATIKKHDYQVKLVKSKELTEKYKHVAQLAVDKYIKCQATMLGVDVSEIKSRLNENYSFNDIDKVCESLKIYQLSVDALPFDPTRRNTKIRFNVTESKETIKEVGHGGTSSFDDECDAQLLGLAQM